MKTKITTAALLAVLSIPASAVVNIDYVTVGNAGNAANTLTGYTGDEGYGGVAYEYRIAKNETTISQYAEFLNAVAATDTYDLYHSEMENFPQIAGIQRVGVSGSYSYSVIGSGSRPITYVSWFDAARFTNWLHNGQTAGLQGSATTEDGAYTLNGATSGVGFTKNVGATVWIPSEDEWYKAAYYDPTKNGGTGGYWHHANQSDVLNGNSIGLAGSANYYDGDYAMDQNALGSFLTDVGIFGEDSQSYYGTNDQGGNVFEWNDAVIGESRGSRGGAWAYNDFILSSSFRNETGPSVEDSLWGFRVASAIPEPTTGLLAILGLFPLLLRRRKA